MKYKKLVLLSILFISSVSYSYAEDNDENLCLSKVKGIFQPVSGNINDPADNKSNPAKIELGKKLYFETKLSLDNSMSCNTCHNIKTFGVDNQPTSKGVKGERGGRNSPTTLNAGYHLSQFWDGRAASLEEQAGGPILNPVEMAMPDEKTVLDRLNKDKYYPGAFKKAFKNEKNPVTYKNLTKAIAAYERTLVTPSRFDKYLNGDINALSKAEKQGLKTFVGKGCISCHNGKAIGGQMYQKFGLVNPYQNQKDLGRYEVTKNEADKYVFKVPSLRNIAKTAPYFHDGKVKTLEEAIKTMGFTQLGLKLSNEEIKSVKTFLESLTGELPKD